MTDRQPGLTKAEIFAVDDLKLVPVFVPGWSTEKPVYIRRITSGEQAEIEWDRFLAADAIQRDKNYEFQEQHIKRMKEKWLVRVVTDENGKRVFDDDDVGPLSKKCNEALAFLFVESLKVNGMDELQLEDRAKNSENSLSNSSGSDSGESSEKA